MKRGRRLLMITVAGAIALAVPASAEAATIEVETTVDEAGMGSTADCSLREAIRSANTDSALGGCTAGSGADEVVLDDETYALTLEGEDDTAVLGDLDVTGPLTITGAGPVDTVIDAGSPVGGPAGGARDRVLHVLPGVAVTVRQLMITGGRGRVGSTGPAGATLGADGGSGGSGGGVLNAGNLTLVEVTVAGNAAGNGGQGGQGTGVAGGGAGLGGNGGTGGDGGGIATTGNLIVERSTISGNRSGNGGNGGLGLGGQGGAGGGGGAAIGGSGGPGGVGGGISVDTPGVLTLTASTVTGNGTGNGGTGGAGFAGAGGDGGAPGGGGGGGSASGGSGGVGGFGGGVAARADAQINASTITDNVAGDGGGGGGAQAGVGGEGADALSIGGEGGDAGGGSGGRGGHGGGVYAFAAVTGTSVTGNTAGRGGPGGAATGGAGGDSGAPGPGGNGGDGTGGDGGEGGYGGGVFSAGSPEVRSSLLANNASGAGGNGAGGSGGPGGTGTFPAPTGAANGGNGGPGAPGGGLARDSGAGTATNVTFNSNSTGAGGNASGNGSGGDGGDGASLAPGINGSSLTVVHATIVGGTVGAGGGAGAGGTPGAAGAGTATSDQGGTIDIRNSIVLGTCEGTTVDGGNNLAPDGTGSGCPGLASDPALLSLADNGGPTQTHALGPGSAARDAAITGGNCPATDQRGAVRPSGAACDVGAYEVAPPGAATGPAQDVQSATATLTGTVEPRGLVTGYRFEFGTTTSYGSQTATQSTLPETGAVAVSAALSGLEPGTTYHYRLVASGPDGTATGEDRTFQTAAPGAGNARITAASLSRRRFAVGRAPTPISAAQRRVARGTTIRLTLSEAASVTIRVERRTTGLRVRRRGRTRCVKATPRRIRQAPRRSRCRRFARAGRALTRQLQAGPSTVAFSGRIGRKALRRGAHRFRIAATGPSGNRSAERRLNFTIVRARR